MLQRVTIAQSLTGKERLQMYLSVWYQRYICSRSTFGKYHVPVSAVLTHSFHREVQCPASTDRGAAASVPPAGTSCCSWPADELQSKHETCFIEAFSQGGPVKLGDLLPKHGNLLVSSLWSAFLPWLFFPDNLISMTTYWCKQSLQNLVVLPK